MGGTRGRDRDSDCDSDEETRCNPRRQQGTMLRHLRYTTLSRSISEPNVAFDGLLVVLLCFANAQRSAQCENLPMETEFCQLQVADKRATRGSLRGSLTKWLGSSCVSVYIPGTLNHSAVTALHI